MKTAKLSPLDHLKIIMLLAMSIGHIAWAFVATDSLLGQVMHFFGRLTIPLACFLVVIGFQLSKNLGGYLKRLFGFGLLAQLPFMMAQVGIYRLLDEPWWLISQLNVLFSLGFALLCLVCLKQARQVEQTQKPVYYLAILVLLIISNISDWGHLPILWVIGIYLWGVMGFVGISLLAFLVSALPLGDYTPFLVNPYAIMDYGLFLAVPFMLYYQKNQHKNHQGNYRLPRLLFYWYYVIHLLILGIFVQYSPWAINEWGLVCRPTCQVLE